MTFKKLILAASLVTATMATSTAAFAADEKKTGSGPNPFADCGIGAALFPETKWAAVTSNVIWDIGITAITSATASPQTCSGKTVAAAVFISNAYDNLAEETATGKGEHVAAVLNILECNSAKHDAAARQIRTSMQAAVARPDYVDLSRVQKASNFYSIVDRAVSTSCSI
jgi:hypothetical protein